MASNTTSLKKKGVGLLTIGALGVVFGDIGTSPLYALQALFGSAGEHFANDPTTVLGVISLIIWSITIVVSIKYISFVMRTDNKGEGGILALVGLIKSSVLRNKTKYFFVFLGLIGVSLFYGDSVITPAISVLSAVEGVTLIVPHANLLILPLTLIILFILFWIQQYGTNSIGKLFGPIMVLWFLTIGIGGLWQVLQHPSVLVALSPASAIIFSVQQPIVAFIAMAAVVLAITGAEALYADMGHFGRQPIARAWFLIVFPALVLCYMGQGALIMQHPDFGQSLFMQLFPDAVRIPILIISTLATLIASQSVISGAFSLTKQAVHLGFLPRMLIKHTSNREIGQVYLPLVNFLLAVAVIVTVLIFQSSVHLANAYGIAVSGALATDTILYIAVLQSRMHQVARIIAATVLFIPLDLVFISSNASKLFHGGLLPILIGLGVFTLMSTWIKGERIVDGKRRKLEGTLPEFIKKIEKATPGVKRIPGHAVYIGHKQMTPLALQATVEDLHELPEKVTIVSIRISTEAHIPDEHRLTFEPLETTLTGVSHIALHYGYHDHINVPYALAHHLRTTPPFDEKQVIYFISLTQVISTKRHSLVSWRQFLYRFMTRNALTASDYYKLPVTRTEEMQSLIKL